MKTLAAIGCCAPASLALLLTGCAVPPQMRIENTSHPSLEDKDVRFRTTYYFRVFDYCGDAQKAVAPGVDTLYRFRMTGKANSLTNQVHFESGTLTSAQIDPLGANVAYDERNKQFYYKSPAESQLEGQRERKLDEVNRLMAQYRAWQDDAKKAGAASAPSTATASTPSAPGAGSPAPAAAAPAAPAVDDELASALRDVIKQRILALKDPEAPSPPAPKPPPPAEASTASTNGTATTIAAAPPRAPADPMADPQCRQSRRGFQILGPEGWRTFNQDERLLLAMSSSGKPLISTMQEISGRILNNQPIEAETLLPLVREDLRISRAERELDKFDPARPERGPILLKAALAQFGAKENAK